MLSALEKFLLQMAEKTGKAKKLTLGEIGQKGVSAVKKTGKAMKESPRAAVGGGIAGALGTAGLAKLIGDDDEDDYGGMNDYDGRY